MYPIKSNCSWKKNTQKRKKQIIKKYSTPQIKVSKTQKNNDNFFKKFVKKGIKILLVLLFFALISFLGAMAWFSKELPDSTELLERRQTVAAKFYDRTGEHLLYDLGSSEIARTKVKLEQIPDYVKWATLVAEDRDFYSHRGIDFKGILRSIYLNTFKPNTRVGGSSISQQFIKNALLSPEKTYTRKIKEIILTWQLEKRFSKDEIFEMYLNEIPYGGTAYGVEAASQKYFNKSVTELSLAEAATLAALPQAPSYLSPYGSNKDQLLARKDWILDSLASEGYLSSNQTAIAKEEELIFSKVSSSIIAPHFVFYVKELVANEFGEQALNEDGLKIITSLDFEKQKTAEETVTKYVAQNIEKYNAHNAALVALNAQTGEILSMVGSANYFNEEIDGAVNVAIRNRQPGSSFKPIVYAAAFQKGFSPNTILFDVPTIFKTETSDYEPANYNNKTFGPVSIKQALAGSLNIPAVKTIYITGINNVINLAEDMGYSTLSDRSRFGLSLVLGGGEIKLLEHAAAFTAFAQDGKLFEPQAILKITNNQGKTIKELNIKKIKGKQVLEKKVAQQITNILSDNNARAYVFGEQNLLNLGNRPVAAKTGTTNDYKDGWTVGYTPSIVTAVWVGNTRGEKMSGSAAGGNVAAPIWHEFMSSITKDTPLEQFITPVEQELPPKPMLNGKMADEITVKIDKISGKLATNLTPDSQIEEKTFKEVHSILHYININNPLGPIPTEPWQDSNYTSWELAVEKWAKENNFETNVSLPEEEDDLHIIENIPNLEILNPQNNTTLNSPQITVNINTSAKRGVKKVEYWLDNILLNTVEAPPFHLVNQHLVGFTNKQYILSVISKDDVDNQTKKTITINLNLPSQYSQPTTFVQPKSGDILINEIFPYPIIVNISNPNYYQKIDFYLIKPDGNSQWLGYKNIDTNQITFTWEDFPKTVGDYKIYGLTTNFQQNVSKSDEINFKIE